MLLGGLYQLCGVEIVDEQVVHAISLPALFYHLNESSMDMWSGRERGAPVNYPLRSWGMVRPHPASLARSLGFLALNPKQLLFSENDVSWDDWVAFWNTSDRSTANTEVIGPHVKLLPERSV